MTTININIYGGDSVNAGYKVSSETFPALTLNKSDISVADAVVRNTSNGNVGMVTMTTAFSADPIEFKGVLASRNFASSIPAHILIPQSELRKMIVTPSADGNLKILDVNGLPTSYKIMNYTSRPAIAGKYAIDSGLFIDDTATEFEFIVDSDPLPAVAVVAIVGIVGCLIKSLIDDLLLDCNKALSAAVAACTASGGLPGISVTSTYGVGYPPFRIGCGATCTLTCAPIPPPVPAAGTAPVATAPVDGSRPPRLPRHGSRRHGSRRHGSRRHGSRRCGSRRCGSWRA